MRQKSVGIFRSTVAVIALHMAASGAVLAQGKAPNRLEVVERVSEADLERFACAHSGRPCEADWIKAVAATLHAEDPKWGLNGKRGDPSDLSLDVVTYRLGPTDRHVQAFDICGACGSPSAVPVWQDITNWQTLGQPGTAVWVKPATNSPNPVPAPTPTPAPTPAPAPVNLQPVLDAVAALTGAVDALDKRLNAILALMQANEANWTKAAHEAGEAAARASDIKTAVDALPAPEPQKCVSGRQSGWAGGAIRLCPE